MRPVTQVMATSLAVVWCLPWSARAQDSGRRPPDLPSDERSMDQWFNTAAFTTPAAFTFGDVGRNSIVGPGLSKADLALDREVPVGKYDLHFRLEAFNVFNTVNYATPNRFVNTPQFGTITEAATAARQIQFVLRATF